jgi:hypothetical protein
LFKLFTDSVLGSGAFLDAAFGPCKGKGSDEQTLFRGLLGNLREGDDLLGDAYFPTYFLLCVLQRLGVDGLFEPCGAHKRSTDFTAGESLGARNHLIVWSKQKRPAWMTSVEPLLNQRGVTPRSLATILSSSNRGVAMSTVVFMRTAVLWNMGTHILVLIDTTHQHRDARAIAPAARVGGVVQDDSGM